MMHHRSGREPRAIKSLFEASSFLCTVTPKRLQTSCDIGVRTLIHCPLRVSMMHTMNTKLFRLGNQVLTRATASISARIEVAIHSTCRFSSKSGNTIPLRVAALQVNCQREENRDNLTHCDLLLRSEISKMNEKPQLILLPELFHCNYNLVDECAWPNAETLSHERKSPAMMYLRKWSTEYQCFIGGSILEASKDGHFYNTFVMFDPLGKPIEKQIRKFRGASFEAFVFAGSEDHHHHTISLYLSLLPHSNALKPEHTFTRPLKVSVGICYENILYPVMRSIEQSSPDLHLAPFCAPEPVPSLFFPPKDAELYRNALLSLPNELSQKLRAFVLSCNKAGRWKSRVSKLFGVPVMPKMESDFLPLTTLQSDTGIELSRLPPNYEGLLSGTIDISLESKPKLPLDHSNLKTYNDWDSIVPMPDVVKNGFTIMERVGQWSYHRWKSAKRCEAAMKLCRGNHHGDD